MKRTIPIAAFVVVALVGAFVATAVATPSMTTSCQGCHSGTALVVTATQTSNDGTTAGYNVTAPGCDYIAVFDGATKYSQITSQTAAITVPAGKTYVLQAVKGPGMTGGFGSTSISPTATVVDIIPTNTVDATCAVTVCDAVARYTGDATIKLTATDNAEGWGVAYIYYQLDGPWTRLITVPANHRSYEANVSVAAPATGSVVHTLKFWSQDNYGNVEKFTTKTFTVVAQHAIAATAGDHGSITASKTVTDGDDATFTITPDAGYHVADVLVDGVSVGAVTSYAFPNVAKDHTISATFAENAASLIATRLTMNVNPTSLSLGHSAHFFGVIAPNMADGTPIALLVRKAGQTNWTRVGSYVRTYSAHHWSRYYHPATRGTYYFKVKFSATATFAGSTSRTVKVVWK